MKNLKLRILFLSLAAVLTLGLSAAVAHASCPQRWVGGNAYGNFDCTFIGECAGWCYYSCSCSNLFPGHTCNDVLTEAGFETVAAPQC